MKKNIFLLLCLLYGLGSNCFGQHLVIHPLKIGEKVPDLVFSKIVNYNKITGNLSDYKGKVVILDFWGVTCSPCIAALPKYDGLQKKYSAKLQIIPITKDAGDVVTAFLNRRWPGEKKLSMPFVVGDTSARQYFPHNTIPHEVWISPQGNVLAITGGDFVTAENIEKAINEERLNLPVKDDRGKTLDFDLFDDLSAMQDNAQHHSFIGGYMENALGLSGESFLGNNSDRFRVMSYNSPVFYLYQQALEFTGIQEQVIFENVKDSSRYLEPAFENEPIKKDAWKRNNRFSYQLVFQATSNDRSAAKQKGLSIMARELNAFFGDKYGLTVTKENRRLPCLVLVRIDTDSKYRSKAKKESGDVEDTDQVFQRYKMDRIVSFLGRRLKKPIVDGTYYDQPVDLRIPTAALKDVALLRKALNNYGLDLVEDEREMEVLVFKETGDK